MGFLPFGGHYLKGRQEIRYRVHERGHYRHVNIAHGLRIRGNWGKGRLQSRPLAAVVEGWTCDLIRRRIIDAPHGNTENRELVHFSVPRSEFLIGAT